MSRSTKKDKDYDEKEYLFSLGEPVQVETGQYVSPDADKAPPVRHHDNETTWTVESYDNKLSTSLVVSGAIEKPSLHDGRIFVCNASQLIQFIAETNGLHVEFRQRKRQQLTDEQIEARRQRMAALNAKKRVQT